MHCSNNSITKVTFRSTLMATGLCFALASCSLMNPYVDESLSMNGGPKVCSSITADMEAALACSTALKSRYLNSMGKQANLNAWTGIGLIPLTAVTIGFAANGDSASKISDFAIGSAGLYSLSNWIAAPERTKIFGVGQKAITCAEQAVQPFVLSGKAKERFNSIVTGFETLHKKYALVKNSLAIYSSESGAKTSLISQAQASLLETQQLRRSAGDLLHQYGRAPGELVGTVKNINATVNEALGSTIQSLNALPGYISGLGELYKQNKTGFITFTPKSETKSNDSGMTPHSGQDNAIDPKSQKTAETELSIAYKLLEEANANMTLLVTELTPPSPAKSLDQCGIDTESISAPITVNPGVLSFTVGTKNKNSLSISGGNGTYTYSADESIFTVSQTPAFGGNLTVSLKDAKPGNYIIKVQDSTGRSEDVPVTINAEQKKEVLSCSLTDDLLEGEGKYCTNTKLTTKLQSSLKIALPDQNIKVDGDYGIRTRAAALAFAKKYKHLKNDVNETSLQAVLDFAYQKELETEQINSVLAQVNDDSLSQVQKVMRLQRQSDLLETGFIGEELL